jgi:WD40 repeat protein
MWGAENAEGQPEIGEAAGSSKTKIERSLKGHTDAVFALAAWSGWLASAGGDRTIRLWDPDSGACVATLRGHTDDIRALATAPGTGSCGPLISASDDRTARAWRWTATGPLSADVLCGHAHGLNAALLLRGAQADVAVTGSDDRTLRVWEIPPPPSLAAAAAAAGRPAAERRVEALRTLTGHRAAVTALAVLGGAAAPAVVSAAADGELRVWASADWACLRSVRAAEAAAGRLGRHIACLAAGGGQLLAGVCGGADGSARALLVWRLDDGRDAGGGSKGDGGGGGGGGGSGGGELDSARALGSAPLVVPLPGGEDVSALVRVGRHEVWGAVASDVVVWGRE